MSRQTACCDWYAVAYPDTPATASTSARTCAAHYRADGTVPEPDPAPSWGERGPQTADEYDDDEPTPRPCPCYCHMVYAVRCGWCCAGWSDLATLDAYADPATPYPGEPCTYGHYDCAHEPGGPCHNERGPVDCPRPACPYKTERLS